MTLYCLKRPDGTLERTICGEDREWIKLCAEKYCYFESLGYSVVPVRIVEVEPVKCKTCNGTGWNHGAQHGASKPGYKSVKCYDCNYWLGNA
ncbi:hypothetical protein [Sphingomonas sp.]|jgi:hypothetical protein|uniref:hypothetical protein n=1 Tax=Sphingomonas sp. TaxID=28214 RepID=UPI003566169F